MSADFVPPATAIAFNDAVSAPTPMTNVRTFSALLTPAAAILETTARVSLGAQPVGMPSVASTTAMVCPGLVLPNTCA